MYHGNVITPVYIYIYMSFLHLISVHYTLQTQIRTCIYVYVMYICVSKTEKNQKFMRIQNC